MYRNLILLALLFFIFVPTSANAAELGSWTVSGSMLNKRIMHTSVALDNGNILVVGGRTTSANFQNENGYLKTTELYSPTDGSWSSTGSMFISRISHTTTLLKNGNVLVAGGYNSSFLADVEIYNPLSGTWSPASNLITDRAEQTSTLLPNGEVFITGGYNDRGTLSSTEIYNPQTNTWRQAQAMTIPRAGHNAVLLENGNVLVVGGFEKSDAMNSAEIYNPLTDTWSIQESMSDPRIFPESFLLRDGRVIVFAGSDRGTIYMSTEIFDPSTNSWSQTGAMNIKRARGAAALLQDGRVMIAGGISDSTSSLTIQNTAEIYDPASGNWDLVASMPNGRYFADAVSLNNGSILLSGGSKLESPDTSFPEALVYNVSQRLSIHDFKQTDPRWSTLPTSPINTQTRLNHSNSCGDMYTYGCAVTSVANVFYSYGKTLLPNNESLDPGTLNNWLANIQGGFVSCAINWGKASTAFNYGAPNIIFRNGNSTWSNGINTIDTALARGDLVILGLEPRANATHFLVVDKKLPDVNGNPDYRLVDPALYPFIANNPGNTGKSFSQVYGSFDKVYEAVIYKKNSQSNKSLTVRAHSPVQLRITDPEGNVTGYNVDSQQIEENIFQSSYGIEYGIAPVDGSLPSSEETKYFQQIDPLEGEYKIEVIGTGNGSYTLDVTNTDENANSSTQILQGYAQSGITEVYNFEYTSDASEAPVIIKEITFDTLHLDIKKLYQQKQIKNVIFYTALKVQAEVAERATLINRQPLGNKLAIITLKAMLVELNKQKGKSITVEGYNLLYTDITSLINQLQGDQNGGSGSGGSNGGS